MRLILITSVDAYHIWQLIYGFCKPTAGYLLAYYKPYQIDIVYLSIFV